MRIAIVNRSDLRGGAAIVSSRLAEALSAVGCEVRMLVVEKLGDSSSTIKVASPKRAAIPFLAERLKLYVRNGFDRRRLFQLDPASDGLPLWRQPEILAADAIFLNWTNQGMLSLKGLKKLLRLGKPVFVTMHDMWAFTGICHHSGSCRRYEEHCGYCPLLKKGIAGRDDLSHQVWKRKEEIYSVDGKNLSFVAVSRWLADRAASSGLLKHFADARRLHVIPNPFPLDSASCSESSRRTQKCPDGNASSLLPLPAKDEIRILFGAARIDDPVKDPELLVETTRILAEKYPEVAPRALLVTFGNLKDPHALDGVAIRHNHLGPLPAERLEELYSDALIVLSSSRYETLPGTLVEGQAFGAIPVSTDHGGQSDIIDHLSTGWLAPWDDDIRKRAESLAAGIIWAASLDEEALKDIRRRMRSSVNERFSPEKIAESYIRLVAEGGKL